eukprot:scaffold319580_cov18-Prasinocladus_malaysianus.AAC.1
MDGWMDEHADRQTDWWMDGRIHKLVDRQAVKWLVMQISRTPVGANDFLRHGSAVHASLAFCGLVD